MRRLRPVRPVTIDRLAWLGVLVVVAACGGGGTSTPGAGAVGTTGSGASAAAATPVDLSADRVDPCALVTPEDIRRISGYANAMTQAGTSEGSCLRRTPDDRFSLVLTTGRYVDLRSSLGGRHVDLGRGLEGYENATGWVTAVIYPDGSVVNVGVSGAALSNESRAVGYRLALADGRVVDLATQYRAYADAVVANSR